MSEYLFIGGGWDGRRENIPNDTQILEVPVRRFFPHPSYGFGDGQGWAETSEVYEKRELCDHDNRYFVYVSILIPNGSMMELLLANYRPQP